ncbi:MULTISPECIES: helix-turn-helix transcriptional regulator [unclassified Chelatococcus]|uniref:helix-turn-helix transcriptional regulator n=1 Tax=unclassified Chelatococcus TaxID=2638111 RepID=UPI001BCDB6F0|nr:MULTISPECIES: helix-turn-helix transcriptional regulator [unclassified Chelatococcus]MBS7698367.1 helix-turn-helix transcriptional regulator [Chelatococcus sp. YT9]MBX3558866.1 helix-turn-helix transcriptional regulator [Chelatococcus sp.]
MDRCEVPNGLRRNAASVAGDVTRRRQTPASLKTKPVWFIEKGASRLDIDLRVTGKSARYAEIDAAHPAPFQARALLKLEPDMGLVSLFAPAPGIEHAMNAVFGPEMAVLLRPAEGILVTRNGGRHAIVGAREAVLITDKAQSTLLMTRVSRLDCFVMPLDGVGERAREAAAAMRVFSAEDDALQMLGNYGAALMRGLMPIHTAELREHVLSFMCNLVNIMSREHDGALARGLVHRPDDRMRAIKSDIEARLTDRSLSARQVADKHAISLRYLQMLFEDEKTTFSEFVLQRRLERAMRMLQTTERTARPISEIAFAVGFGDLSYFNRTFRRRFGTSPRDARASHRAVASALGASPRHTAE